MNSDTRLAILGASGHGKVVADIALLNGWKDIFFYDDAWPSKRVLEHWRLRGSFDDMINDIPYFDGVIVAIGNNALRESKLSVLHELNACLVSLVHPRSTVSDFATIGAGCVLVAGAVINAFATLGSGCIVNTNATVGHDCHLDSCVHIAPGASVAGDVNIGRCCWVGAGSVIRQGVTLNENVTVGVGAAVVSDVQKGETVVGVPAISMKR